MVRSSQIELRSHGVIETPVIIPTHTELCLTVRGNEDCLVTRTGAGQVSIGDGASLKVYDELRWALCEGALRTASTSR